MVALLWGAGVLWSGYFEESKPVDGLLAISAGSWLSFLILGLEHPGSLTGDTHLRSGLVVMLSPIQNTSYPSASLGSMGLPSTEKHLPHPTGSSMIQGNFSRLELLTVAQRCGDW